MCSRTRCVCSGCGGAGMPNLLEWMPLGGEPGCREAAMDPQNIKLFGQTISVTKNHTGAGADAEVPKLTSASPPWDTAPTSHQVSPFFSLDTQRMSTLVLVDKLSWPLSFITSFL